MRACDLTEYNKGEAGQGLSDQLVKQLAQQAQFLTHFFREQLPVRIFHTHMDQDKYFILEWKDQIVGYFWCRRVTDQIYQIKLSHIYPQFQNQGLGTESYVHIVRNTGVAFIHDSQLSDQAEHIWRAKLPAANLIRGIYDRKLDQTYDVNRIGQPTSDGVMIVDPSEDVSDPIQDPDGSSQRFFWITKNSWGRPATHLLEAHAMYHDLGHQLWNQDKLMWHRANQSLKVIESYCGF
jgi:hypothetical protein